MAPNHRPDAFLTLFAWPVIQDTAGVRILSQEVVFKPIDNHFSIPVFLAPADSILSDPADDRDDDPPPSPRCINPPVLSSASFGGHRQGRPVRALDGNPG
jgi:hypothetical protein